MQLLILAASEATTTANATIVLAVGTVVLVAATMYYAYLTRVGNKATERSANAAEQSARSAGSAAESAAGSLLLAAMPLVLGYNFDRLQDTDGYGAQLLNEGPATAFNLEATVTYLGIHGSATLPLVSLASLASRTEKSIEWKGDIVKVDGPYVVEVVFSDPLGRRYRTQRHSLSDGDSAILVQRWEPDINEWATVVDSGVDRA